MAKRRRRTPARWLAPVALVTCAVAVYAVVDNTLLKEDTTSSGNTTSLPATKTKTTSSKPKKHRRVYIVKSGDTLSAISIKTGVSLTTMQRLNPKLDADTLHAGEHVRLAK